MSRRLAVCLITVSVVGIGRADPGGVGVARAAQSPAAVAAEVREVAVTIDDLPTVSVLGNDFGQAERITADLVSALARHHVPAIGFVNEQKLAPAGTVEPRRVALLQQWIDAGLELGNHSYSHPDLNTVSLEAYEADVLRGEPITRRLMIAAGKSLRYFRHPFLHTGRSPELRRELLAFLTSRGYLVAPVTIDNSDYVFAAAFDRVSETGNTAGAERIAAAYIDYMEAVTAYYEQQSVAIVGREIAQTLLLHANALNAATFDRLAARLEARRYRFVSLERALRDPAYELPDTYSGPGGITWLHRWAITAKTPPAVFKGEPEVPEWVTAAAALR